MSILRLGAFAEACENQNICALKHTHCTGISNCLNYTDTKQPLKKSTFWILSLLY